MMSAKQASGPNAFQWSNCSSLELQASFKRVSCYDNIPPKNITLPKLPPGHKFDGSKQCTFLYGKEYTLCPVTTGNCALLFCFKVGGCVSIGTPPVDGTPCGNRKWCVGGHCVGVGTSLPPAIDGGWGAWGAFGSCSRTCGGGLRYRTRVCDNPSPMHDGKPCPGLTIGEWEMCNLQDCPPGGVHYRLFQCRARNPSYSNYYIYGSRCYLWCILGSSARGEGNVADGTKYNEDPLVLDVCITGKRVPVGCDHGIRSGKIKDRCMKCKGDGGTCVRKNGTYHKQWRQWGSANADTMFVLPVNTTNFYIKEIIHSNNVLNLKLYPPSSNPMIFPERPLKSSRNVAGTTVFYDISNSNLNHAESMYFEGPTTQALVAMFVYAGHYNLGYSYHYYTPGIAPNTSFIWKFVPSGECSATCAIGLRAQIVTCHREDDDSRVDEEICNMTTRPKNQVPCNTQPCPARWEAEPWGPCSSRCGGGNRTRPVPCVQQVTSTKYVTIASSHCNISTRPHQTSSCNQINCPPAWVVTDWSECLSVNGSQSTTKREVKCQIRLANGTVITTSHEDCTRIDKMVPASVKNCTVVTTTKPITTQVTTEEVVDTTAQTEPGTPIPATERNFTSTTTTDQLPGPGDTETSISPWVPITLTLAILFCLALTLVLLYRAGYLTITSVACHHNEPVMIDGIKLDNVPMSESC